MAGLVRTAGAFFTFYAIVYGTFLVLSGFFRLLGAISFSFDTAPRMASALVISMVVYSGYLIPEPAMKRWLVWVSISVCVKISSQRELNTIPDALMSP